MNKIEIEDLENVNGGAVLVDDSLPIVYLINDKNGSIADMALATFLIVEQAKLWGFSTERISLDEYRKRYGDKAVL